jgi:hypothetical protein
LPTSEHLLAIAVEDGRAWLEILGLEELGDGNGLGLWRAGVDGRRTRRTTAGTTGTAASLSGASLTGGCLSGHLLLARGHHARL